MFGENITQIVAKMIQFNINNRNSYKKVVIIVTVLDQSTCYLTFQKLFITIN